MRRPLSYSYLKKNRRLAFNEKEEEEVGKYFLTISDQKYIKKHAITCLYALYF